jgi:purine-nucleoside phosphorylase
MSMAAPTPMKVPVRTLHAIGCESLILTNCRRQPRSRDGAGAVMMITDHINLVQSSPLYDESGNSRFVDMVGAYDAQLQQQARDAARATGVTLHEGVYVWFSGPHFETPAEVRFARLIGGDRGRHVDRCRSDPGAPGRDEGRGAFPSSPTSARA